MEEKFIPIETKEDKEKEEKDKNKDSKCKEEKPEKLLSLATKKRKAKDIKKKYFRTSPRKIRKIFDWKISNFPKYQKANKANLYSNYTIVGMTESEQIIMACYNYLQINDNLKEGDSVNLNIFDYDIIIKLIRRYPNLVAVINGETLTLYYLAREITFINDENKIITKKFIYNPVNLIDSLKKLKFESYYIKLPKENTIKDNNIININEENESSSESSEVSLDPFTIFNDESIKYIYSENKRPILNYNNYDNRFNEKIPYLKDLSNCSKYYYKNPCSPFIELDNNYYKPSSQLIDFEDSIYSKVVYLYGPKRSSKTTFLLNMINQYQYYSTRTFYFNFNFLETKNLLERKKIIYHELLYFCIDYEEMKKIETTKFFNKFQDKNNIMELIYNILKVLLDIISPIDTIRRIIIIDNIYNNDSLVLNYLNEIIKLIYTKNSNIKLIISGNGPYFNNKFLDFYEKFHVMTTNDDFKRNGLIEFMLIYYANNNYIKNIINDEEKKENENKDELILKKELEQKIYSFYQIYLSEELNKRIFSYKTIMANRSYISQFPLEYFEIKMIKEGLEFNFYDNTFKQCFRNIVGFEIEKGTLTNLLKRNDYPRTFLGVCFEKLITLLLIHNKMNLRNLIFKKNNIKEISEIAKLKEEYYSGPKFEDINKDEPILLVQENFFGPLYDLLVLTKRNNFYYSDFIQIGVDKTKEQIEQIINDLESKYNKYKENILKAFGIDTNYISVLFIFDYATQKEKNYSTGFKICQDKSINFYLFSIKDCSLITLNKDKNFEILVDEYSPSFIIKENKNINFGYNKKKNKKKKESEDKNECSKITDYFSSWNIK